MSNEDKRKPWQDTIKWEYESARQREKIFKQTLKKFATDQGRKDYLNQFQNTEHSVQFYAWQKARWLVDKDQTEWCLDYNSSKDLLNAQACLGNIQQKKLFDKQCQWRAETFTHPSIETSSDFTYWEKNILNCPFIDPITEEDVALYIEFLQQYLGEDLSFLGHWQDYNTYNSSFPTVSKLMNKQEKEEEDEDDEESSLMPPWYIFVNEHTGNGHYLLLPDVRQEKEWKYGRIGQQELQRLAMEKMKASPPRDTRPYLSNFGKEKMEDFINEVEEEPEEVLKAYSVYIQMYDSPEKQSMEWVKEACYDLDDCYEPFPIAEGITDWKEALIATAQQWKNTKITRNLPFFYQDYLFRNATGIKNVTDEDSLEIYRKMGEDYKESILLGRELSGEPRDLNF
jgi:hypothetical protein